MEPLVVVVALAIVVFYRRGVALRPTSSAWLNSSEFEAMADLRAKQVGQLDGGPLGAGPLRAQQRAVGRLFRRWRPGGDVARATS